MEISIIGLGYVGLPLALLSSFKGHKVRGVEKNQSLLNDLKSNKLHLIDDYVIKMFENIKNMDLMDRVKSSQVYVVCVPTPVNETNLPDLKYVKDAVEEIALVLEDNQLVVIESTIYPGVCEEIVKPILDKSGKKYLLAHCPERINPGDKKWNVQNIPRVVGGIDEKSTKFVKEFYESVIDANILGLSQIKAAEATKILENTFRDVNIAFINEMAQSFFRMNIDVSEVIMGASTKPFAFIPHYPGVGVGGHCIAVDPYYMIQKGKEIGFDHVFLTQARKINSSMPRYTIKLIQNELNLLGYPINGTKIAVLGLSYKPNVSDDRESPSYDLIKILNNKKADLVIYDPFLLEKSDVSSLKEALADVTCVLIATAHKEFLEDLSIYKDIKLFIDGRNAFDKAQIENLGLVYRGIGRR